MANGITILPQAQSKFQGIGGFANNLVTQLLQRQQQRRSGQQFGQAFGQQFSGITNPNIQNLIGAQLLQAAKPIPAETKAQIQAQEIRRLQAIPEAQRTKGQKDSLKRLLEGQAAVQISFGKSTASERTALAKSEASLDALDNLDSLFKLAETRTGPVVGRTDPIAGIFGLTTSAQENFLAASSALENSVIKEITGSQMSEVEATRILKQVPRPTDPPARWKAKMNQTRINIKFMQKRRQQVLLKSGIINPLTGQVGESINIRTPESQGASDEEILRIIAGGQ